MHCAQFQDHHHVMLWLLELLQTVMGPSINQTASDSIICNIIAK
jgi:hypothetical protein